MSLLPKVASNFFTTCKKCDQERYHKVLTHVSESTAKLECEVCHSKKTVKFNQGSVVAKKAKKTGGKTKAEAAAAATNALYNDLLEKRGTEKSQPYRMSQVYQTDATIEHPKFGVGFVVQSLPDKIEVVFQDASRHLVQGRK